MRKKENSNYKHHDMLAIRTLISQDYSGKFELDYFRYLLDEKVLSLQKQIYLKIITWINEGKSYEEISQLIDDLELHSLKEDEEKYIKDDAQDIIKKRKIKERERMI